ncbi:hypothetical protein PtrSN002B_010021 [Pyrenophora tritici-repentis]|uniref:C2H2-type domain-containing protein n=2 Tax=Pyrenophora tritici-repentis TaxID=45151 RepID=A0A2W1GJE8_9PLEO|nr:uncharacterized protein PTRG_00562 [Pyrenophora tritici-repentis Pt-1C-BFP]KAA8625166.1 hypothetical protein PtrV1_00846 [Pyrenophora tritici-repentis]EDU40000.1 predicted protein [Pyrenophora tritici-repentis Pt-1C-BFP]KAF7453565.1 hypothetical protein A1F99_008230 [Pyrenophora tritici-repentis]KAF7576645.1 hypothetical protein PtrM4_008850 [Pyrenophora tritici-repentis]KAG9387323.1 hypothetical protein A1F94_000215 [Pyrenophora tritici-repentis]
MAPNEHQEDGNQWQSPDTEESFSAFPPSNDSQTMNGMGAWDSMGHIDPSLSVDMNWSQHPNNTHQQMHGGANDVACCTPASPRDDRFQLDDPNNYSIESINAVMDMAERLTKRERQYWFGMTQQHVVDGSNGLHMPSNTTLSSFNRSSVSGAEGSTTTPSSTGMYADNTTCRMMIEDSNTRNCGLLVDELSQGFRAPLGNALDPHQFLQPLLPLPGNQEIGLYPGCMTERPFGYDPNSLHSTMPTQLSDTRSTTDASSTALSEIHCDEKGCNKVFHGKWRRGNLARHQKQVHKDQAIFICAACDRVFRRDDARLKHMRKQHNRLVKDSLPVPRRRAQTTNGEQAQDLKGILGWRD